MFLLSQKNTVLRLKIPALGQTWPEMAQLLVYNSRFLLPQTLQEIAHRSPFKMASVVTLTNVETPWSLFKNPPGRDVASSSITVRSA